MDTFGVTLPGFGAARERLAEVEKHEWDGIFRGPALS